MKWIILLFCLVIGTAALFYGIKLLRLLKKVKRWDRVKAKVLSKQVVDKKLSQASRANKTVDVQYEFIHGGRSYRGDKVFLVSLLKGERGFYPDDAARFLSRIPDEIDVHVDPADPNNSIIYADGMLMYVFMIVAGIGMLLGGIGYFFSI